MNTIDKIDINILPQPDDVTCGPTCLQAVYRYYGKTIDLTDLIEEVNYLEDGGTLAVLLGIDALERGYETKIITYNLKMFDPTWTGLPNWQLVKKLQQQLKFKKGKKFTEAAHAYIEYLEKGGKISFDDLTPDLLRNILRSDVPILTGLSATYLYNTTREYTNHKNQSVFDDLKGEPMGHFVVLSGMDDDLVLVADPYKENPIAMDHYYRVEINRLLNSILLGIITYDANLLLITP